MISRAHLALAVLGQLIAPLLIIYREALGKGWISSSSVGTSTANGDRDIHLARFTDIQFASDVCYSQTTDMRTSQHTSKLDSSGRMTIDVDVEELSEGRHEEIELRELPRSDTSRS